MRFRLEFDVPDKAAKTFRTVVLSEGVVQIRNGMYYSVTVISNVTLTQLPTGDEGESAVNTIYMTAILESLHDVGIRYGCGGTPDHELVSDTLLALETGIRKRLNGELV